MSGSTEEMLERVELMAGGDSGVWDLSPNDCDALRSVLGRLQDGEQAVAELVEANKRLNARICTLEASEKSWERVVVALTHEKYTALHEIDVLRGEEG